MTDLTDRITGSLLGLAVGDVLGCPLESMHPHKIASEFGKVTSLVSVPERKGMNTFYWRLPGAHSDDTQQALTIADVLAETGGLDTGLILARWKEMGEARIEIVGNSGVVRPKGVFGCHRGASGGFRRRVRKPGAPLEPNWGDGAAMRVAPIGLYYRVEPGKRIEAALRSALMTHGHPHAIASAVAVAAAVSSACRDDSLTPAQHLSVVRNEVDEADELLKGKYARKFNRTAKGAVGEFSLTLAKMADWLALPLSAALESVAANGRDLLNPPAERSVFATQSASILAVVTALLVALRNFDSFYDGLVEALNLGGDTDTIGAIVGAILGARLGSTAIPEEWKDSVLARAQVEARGVRLATGRITDSFEDQIDFETEITRQEAQARSELRQRLRA